MQYVPCTAEGLCNGGVIENTQNVFHEMKDHPEIIYWSIGISLSIATFNFTGVSVTKYASAAQRSTVDTLRTFFIWMISIMLGREDFSGL